MLGDDVQQMMTEVYSRSQGCGESVKEFRESLLQIAQKIMNADAEFRKDVDTSLKARFADGSKDQYLQVIAREVI